MEPGRATPLTPSETEEALKHAPYHNDDYVWWSNSSGQLHHINDLPAVVYIDGTQRWYHYHQLHRGNGLPAIICCDGTMTWYEHDKKTGNQDNPPPNARFPGQQTKSASKKQ